MDIAPEAVIAVTAFGNEAVDMRVPFQIPAKGVEDHDKAGSEVHGFILFIEHLRDNLVHSMKEAVKQCPVMKEKLPKVFVNGKNTMTVGDIDQFKGHGCSAPHSVKISTSRAETAVAAEGNKFELSAMGAAIHGATKGWIAAA